MEYLTEAEAFADIDHCMGHNALNTNIVQDILNE